MTDKNCNCGNSLSHHGNCPLSRQKTKPRRKGNFCHVPDGYVLKKDHVSKSAHDWTVAELQKRELSVRDAAYNQGKVRGYVLGLFVAYLGFLMGKIIEWVSL